MIQDQGNIKQPKITLEQGYDIKLLDATHIQQIHSLRSKSFQQNNPLFLHFGITYEESEKLSQSTNYQLVLSQNLSYGAFKAGQLVSMAIMSDYTLSFRQPIPEPSENIQKLFSYVVQFTSDQKKEKDFEPGKCIQLYILATDGEHTQKNLASLCTQKGLLEAKARGFQCFKTNASHIGTKKAVEKIFDKIIIEKAVEKGDICAYLITANL